MPVDPSVYSLIKPSAPIAGPLDNYGQMMSIKQLMDSAELNSLQRRKLTTDLDEEAAFKKAFAEGGDINAPDFLKRLMAASPSRAMAAQKAGLETKKLQGDIDKNSLERLTKSVELHRGQLAGVNTPQDAAQWVKSGFDDPNLSPFMQRAGRPEQWLAKIPQDPQGFEQWKLQNGLGLEKFTEHVDRRRTADETARSHRAGETMARANLEIKGAEATPGGSFSIPDIVNRALRPQPGAGGAPAAAGAPAAPAASAPASGAPAAPGAAPQGTPVDVNVIQKAMQSGATGDELLGMLPKPVADQVKAMVEGRMAPPSSFALKTPYWQGMIQLGAQYEPNFDQTLWGSRKKTREAFAAGTEGKNLTNINTAIGHLDSFDKAAQALKNSDFPLFNKLYNAAVPQIGGTTTAGNIRTFEQAKEAVANELMRVFRGVGASSSDTAKWAETLNSSDSPEALRAAVKSAVDLLESRIGSLSEQYKKGMGTDNQIDVLNMVYPKARATLDRLREGQAKAPEKPDTMAGDKPKAQTFDTMPDPAKYRGRTIRGDDGTMYNSDGKRWVRQGG